MAALLQHRAASLIARIQTTGARGHCLVFKASRIASTSSASNGRKAHHTLRLKSDHLIGAVHINPFIITRVPDGSTIRTIGEAAEYATSLPLRVGNTEP